MFGYIKPVKCELRVREWEHYRAVYCGLCHALRTGFGISARFIINYDFTFLALVLSDNVQEYEKRRCIAHPFCARNACIKEDAFSVAAAASVILSRWQLCDEIADKPFFKGFPARVARMFLNHAYKKAKSTLPEFDATVCCYLDELHKLEEKREPSLDAPADAFAKITASLADFCDGEKKRIMHELFYHVGRSIYLTDALADIKDDLENDNYNPIAARFSIENTPLEHEVKEAVKITVYQSVFAANAAFSLLDHSHRELIDNILNLGIPAAVSRAELGEAPKKEKMHERPV